MLTLYHAPGSASSRIVWLLEELYAEYDLVPVADAYADGAPADRRNPHPHGFAPALDHDGQVVTETGAVALYLTDLFPRSTLGAPPGDALRGRYLTWLFYQVGLAEPLVYLKGSGALARDAAMGRLDAMMMRHVEATLAGAGPYLLGGRFTAADILTMSLFGQARALLGPSAAIDAYLALADRPARRRAEARERRAAA